MAHEDRSGRLPEAVERALAYLHRPRPEDFEARAREVFAFQFAHNEPYRRFCRRRGATPETVAAWSDIPPVPVAAFKGAPLTCGPATRVFRTSGTSRGPAARGEHPLPTLDLYHVSWVDPFRVHLLPDRESIRMVSLIPHEDDLPDSSLSFMVTRAVERFGLPGSVFAMDREGLRESLLDRTLVEATALDEPVLLLTTGFAALHWLDLLGGSGRRLTLPAGSRIMDTGGFKGRTRDIPREEMLDLYADRLGVLGASVVGEYGMTELSSQFYEHIDGSRRVWEGPPWVRTRVLDPETLDELPAGEPGLLAHFDLANAWTVAAVLTEDLGAAVPGGFRLLGRARGAELRGCSQAAREILEP